MTNKPENTQGVSAIFYSKPVPLDRDNHKDFKLLPISEVGCDFAEKTRAVYITAIEFAEASKEYPIVFVKNENEFTAMVALSVDGKSNAFVTGHKWQARYLPAFIRRYPFIPGMSAEDKTDKETGENKFTLLVDETYKGFSKDIDGVALFKDDEPTAELAQITDFVRNYHVENIKTNTFVKTLDEMGLLADKRLQITFPDGSTQYSIAGTWMVDEDKLKNLDTASIEKLHQSGYLFLIYMHIASLRNFTYLAELQSQADA